MVKKLLIVGKNNYYVYKDGRVQNSKTKRFTQPHPDKNGYLRVVLYDGNKTVNFIVHRLIALLYIPNPDNKPMVNHINGNKRDNRIKNLEWVSNLENIKHAWDNKLMNPRPGTRHHNCKLTEEDVLYIRKQRKLGVPRKVLAEKFNVRKNHITRITTGLRWKCLEET